MTSFQIERTALAVLMMVGVANIADTAAAAGVKSADALIAAYDKEKLDIACKYYGEILPLMNQDLPSRQADSLVLDVIELKKQGLLYRYTLTAEGTTESLKAKLKDPRILDFMQKLHCDNESFRRARRGRLGATFSYVRPDKTSLLDFSYSVKDCPNQVREDARFAVGMETYAAKMPAFNKDLPAREADALTLDRIEMTDYGMLYRYTLTVEGETEAVKAKLNQRRNMSSMYNMYCEQDAMRLAREFGLEVTFSYARPDKTELGDFTYSPANCPSAAAAAAN